MKNTVTIFSVSHIETQFPNCSFIKPILVKNIHLNTNEKYYSDNTGINISEKNSSFNELTALFWIWKNLDSIDSNYIGLCHYRRYFIEKIPETLGEKINSYFHSKKSELILNLPKSDYTFNIVSSPKVEKKFNRFS